MTTDPSTATPRQPARLTPPEVADRLRTIDLRAGYIIGACKDTREMRLEAEEIKRLVDETFKGLRAWWHGDMAQSAIEQSNTAPQGQGTDASARPGRPVAQDAHAPAVAAPLSPEVIEVLDEYDEILNRIPNDAWERDGLETDFVMRAADYSILRDELHRLTAVSATNAAPQGGLANAGDHDSGGSDDASVMGAAPASAALSEAEAFEQPDFMTEAQKAAYWFDLYLEETAKRRKLERARNAWEAKFNAECEKHDATTMRAMIAERELAEARANADDWMRRYGSTQGHPKSNPSATAPTSGEISTAHVYRDACGDMRIAIRYADATEEDRPATSFEVAVSAKISEIAASLQASHLPQNEKHG